MREYLYALWIMGTPPLVALCAALFGPKLERKKR